MEKRILILDDDTDICTLLSRFLTKNGYTTETAFSGSKAVEMLKVGKFDLLISDFRLGDTDSLKLLEKLHLEGLTLPVIIITGYSDIKMAVNVIKAGALDYVSKPLIPDEILMMVKRALGEGVNDENVTFKARSGSAKKAFNVSSFLVGKSKVALELYRQIDLVAPTNYSVIIYGESGSGKEAVARSIHDRSDRRSKPFVAMDCGAISRELAGSELFGHEKGSFTGAINSKIGHFELANGGTLFLDEIGNLGYDIQVSMLRVIQERRLKRIGGNKEIDLDVRIVIASNENLAVAFRNGKFREDLYHRFNEFTINVPPLRERDKDIVPFAEHFLQETNVELQRNIIGFSDEVKDIFMQYSWPGNIRELKNMIKRAALLTKGEIINVEALPDEMKSPEKSLFLSTGSTANGEVANKTVNFGKSTTNLKEAALEAEYETIMNVLQKVQFNKSKAARLLNIDRKTLYNKMKHYNLLNESDGTSV
ncbi:MAG: sigma-54-dependent Fis family transcriptional regulator [Bacteroidetes bacterium]|nr:sigma-54-dependent Fis family transcriptional regulator [Bacteroidota bacterium]